MRSRFSTSAAAVVLAGSAALSLVGCTAATKWAGPSCEEFLQMPEDERTTAVVDWARRYDKRVDQSNPNVGQSGYALFIDRGSLITYCQDTSHRSDHLGSLVPAG